MQGRRRTSRARLDLTFPSPSLLRLLLLQPSALQHFALLSDLVTSHLPTLPRSVYFLFSSSSSSLRRTHHHLLLLTLRINHHSLLHSRPTSSRHPQGPPLPRSSSGSSQPSSKPFNHRPLLLPTTLQRDPPPQRLRELLPKVPLPAALGHGQLGYEQGTAQGGVGVDQGVEDGGRVHRLEDGKEGRR